VWPGSGLGCLAGSPGAFDLFVVLHRRAVYRHCSRFVGNHEDGSDLSQKIVLRAHRGLTRIRAKSSLSTCCTASASTCA
jgi:DNA-directed RNA polymerase specialized sigma24 family protein